MAFQFWIRLTAVHWNLQRSNTGDHDTNAGTFQVFKNGVLVGQGGRIEVTDSGTVSEFAHPGGTLSGPNPLAPTSMSGLITEGWVLGPIDLAGTDTLTVCCTATNVGDGCLSQSEKDIDQLTEKRFDAFDDWLFGQAAGEIGLIAGAADLVSNISDYTDKITALPDEAKAVIRLIEQGSAGPAAGLVRTGIVTDKLTDAATHSDACGGQAESIVYFSVPCSHTPISIPAPAGGDVVQSTWGNVGNFELLAPAGGTVRHLVRINDAPSAPWTQVHTFGYAAVPGQVNRLPMMAGHASVIQSQCLGDGVHGNLEAVLTARSLLGAFAPHVDHGWMGIGSGSWHGPESVVTAEGETVLAPQGDPVMLQGNWGHAGHFDRLVPNGSRIPQDARNNDLQPPELVARARVR